MRCLASINQASTEFLASSSVNLVKLNFATSVTREKIYFIDVKIENGGTVNSKNNYHVLSAIKVIS